LWYKDSRWDEEIGEAGETNYDGILVNPMTGALHGDILEKMAEVAFKQHWMVFLSLSFVNTGLISSPIIPSAMILLAS
jgi:hypothetical protein